MESKQRELVFEAKAAKKQDGSWLACRVLRPAACRASVAFRLRTEYSFVMRFEFTAVIEPAEEGGYWATCPEVPGANGQGETVEETKRDLAAAIQLILQDRREDALRGLPKDAIQDTVALS